MKNLNLIISREYTSRVKKKSFILMTLLTPFIMLAIIGLPLILAEISGESKQIVIIDQTGLYSSLEIEEYDGYTFKQIEESDKPERSEDNGVFAVLQISSNLSENPRGVSIFSEKQIPNGLMNHLDNIFSELVKEQRLENLSNSQNIDKETLNQVQVILASQIKVSSYKWSDDGEEQETSSHFVTFVALGFTFLLYIFVSTYGGMVMQAVVEEKSNRIVEVMISTIKPFDLMLGKIIGIGLVGLTQMLIWGLIMLVAIPIMQSIGNQSPEMGEMQETLGYIQNVNWGQLISSFMIYFIGGYLIYASIFAMFGSTVDNPQDAQQFVLPVSLLLLFALYAGMYSTSNPDGPLAVWTSIIPFTSPIVMVNRIAFGVSTSELITSMVLLIATAILMIYLAGRIYRVGIFMYGKKPSLKEIGKWFFYK